jgi:hypothetical protein
MGALERTSTTHHTPPPGEPTQVAGPVTLIPQRERITFLVRLSEAFIPLDGIVTAFAVVQGFAVLNTIPLGLPGRAMTVGCRYGRDGTWWFYNVHSDESICPVNDAGAAAQQIRNEMGEAAAA